jgi:hypothetical protein
MDEPPQGEGEDDGKPKFKPENYSWTSYDGNPRNYVQTLLRLKRFPLETSQVKRQNAGEYVFSVLQTHLSNWEDTNYGGVLNLTKII